MRYLTVQEIAAINKFLIQKYSPGEQIGIKDYSLLESATYRPQSSAFGEDAYPTIFDKSAALFESLAQNHSFHNANKRTALASIVFFLRYNNHHFHMSTDEKIEWTVDVVKHKYSLKEIAEIIENHTTLD